MTFIMKRFPVLTLLLGSAAAAAAAENDAGCTQAATRLADADKYVAQHQRDELFYAAVDGQMRATLDGFLLTLVETEGLFIEVAEQMVGIDTDISSLDRPLQEAPKILDPVRVDASAHKLDGVVDRRVDVILGEAAVTGKGVRI